MRTMNALLSLPSTLRRLLQASLERRGNGRAYLPVSQGPDGDVADEEGEKAENVGFGRSTRVQEVQRALGRHRFAWFGGLLVCVLLVTTLFSPATPFHHQRQRPTGEAHAHFLYLLKPASHADDEFCKTVLTAEVLGYPPPWLLDWDRSLDEPARTSERDLAKMTAIRDYLENIPQSKGDSLVLLVDGSSSWFQLRPEVLLSRYYRIIDEANQRLNYTVGEEAVEAEDLQQTVVFSAQNHCVANAANKPSCYAVPPTPPGHVPDKNRRLNTGTAIGPVKAMLPIFQRAIGKADGMSSSDIDYPSIMSEIFGEQELQRALIRNQNLSRWRAAWESFGSQLGLWDSVLAPRPGREAVGYREGTPDEFGITLDYGNELGLSIAPDANVLASKNHAPGSAGDTSARKLPNEVTSSTPPFWTISGYGLPSEQTWADVNLLLDSRTDSVPAVINFASPNNDNEKKSWWKKLWLQPHARTLYDSAALMPGMPTARVLGVNGTEQVFWKPKTTMEKAGARAQNGGWMAWDSVCNGEGTVREVFGDGLGAWKDPAP